MKKQLGLGVLLSLMGAAFGHVTGPEAPIHELGQDRENSVVLEAGQNLADRLEQAPQLLQNAWEELIKQECTLVTERQQLEWCEYFLVLAKRAVVQVHAAETKLMQVRWEAGVPEVILARERLIQYRPEAVAFFTHSLAQFKLSILEEFLGWAQTSPQ